MHSSFVFLVWAIYYPDFDIPPFSFVFLVSIMVYTGSILYKNVLRCVSCLFRTSPGLMS